MTRAQALAKDGLTGARQSAKALREEDRVDGIAEQIASLVDSVLCLVMGKRPRAAHRRGQFVTTLIRYPGKGGWTFAPIRKRLAPPATRPWGRTPVRAVVDGVAWDTSVWRDANTQGALLAVPSRIRGRKESGDQVTVEFTYDDDDD